MTQAEKFQQAVNKNREEQVQRDSKGGGFTKIIYAPLITNANRAFRFTGLPHSVREKPTDSKLVYMAQIIGDDGKKFFVNGPNPEDHKSWFLYKVINKVLSYTWDAETVNLKTGKKGMRLYNYITSHPAIFNMVNKNGNPNNDLEKGWNFSPMVLTNVIDRADMAWHRENKKLKVLSKKVSKTAKGDLWYDRGYPEMLYRMLMEDIVSAFGPWEMYDIVIQKKEKLPFYKVHHAVNDSMHFSDDAKLLADIGKGPMTGEEKEWVGWDFDELFKVTSYARIHKNIGDQIRRISKELKTPFDEELLQLVETEEAEKSAKKDQDSVSKPVGAANAAQDQEDDQVPDETAETSENVQAQQESPVAAAPAASAPSQTATPKTRQGQPSTPAFDPETLMNDPRFKGAHLLTPAEKAWILGVDGDGKLIWSPEAGELIPDAENQDQLVPERVNCNPYNGRVYPVMAA